MGLINKVFFHIGHYAASHPFIVCWGALMLIMVTGIGLVNIRVTVSYLSISIFFISEQSTRTLGPAHFKSKY